MKVYLDTIGCRLNQSEIETFANQFRSAGHQLVSRMEEADLMVLNTCTVTAAAASDSRQKIRQAHKSGVEKIVVTGCMSTLQPEEAAAMPGVIRVVSNEEKEDLVANLLEVERQTFDQEPIARQPIPGSRNRTRAFIKVQDGCDNRCTFCITTVARGENRSLTEEKVIDDIRGALTGGVQEVVLTGVHLGSWGHDFASSRQLGELIQSILEHTDIPRLRVSSLEPWDLDADFFDLWGDPRLCRHLHLPLQSGSAGVLRRMARKTNPPDYAALVESARARIPGVAVTTDLIAGFPGETEEEFAETCAFVKEMEFAGAHVFTYSAREGTAAAKMPHQVHNYTRKERSATLRDITTASAQVYRRGFLGEQIDVLWESIQPVEDQRWRLSGLTDNYLRVQTTAAQPVWNQITLTRLTDLEGSGLRGEITTYPHILIQQDRILPLPKGRGSQ
jgi:threonylcarbamoyladenosine tRNA methylthiotransferase MtaB